MTQRQGFVEWYISRFGESNLDIFRFFSRKDGDYFTAHGQQAYYIAQEVSHIDPIVSILARFIHKHFLLNSFSRLQVL